MALVVVTTRDTGLIRNTNMFIEPKSPCPQDTVNSD
jgi:hypothetical protein